MGPHSLRRYRAERLLRDGFETLRSSVLPAVQARLRSHGVSIDESDLEACYSTALQGLYTSVLGGEEIHNPTGWLVLVTYRRAIDEQRKRRAETELPVDAAAEDRDLSAEIDDRAKLHQLMEGIGSRLSERERQAAALCYLLGLTRAEAAKQMGIGEGRMKKLMEGRGLGQPGVASKMGALTQAISEGRFCEEQASLMRAFAFDLLDPEGDRYKIALAHQQNCPACRAYVRELRGLAALLPPIFLPGLLGGLRLGGGGGAAAGAGASGSSAAGTSGTTAGTSGTTNGAMAGVGSQAAASSQAAGVSAAATGVGGVKFAVAGALLVGAVAGTVAFAGSSSHARSRPHTGGRAVQSAEPEAGRPGPHERRSSPTASRSVGTRAFHRASTHRAKRPVRQAPSPSAAWREFGIERERPVRDRSQATPPTSAAVVQKTSLSPRPSSAGSARAQREFGIE
jgi:RNA polymerase sigma factor (sigma-70 family)